MATKSPYSGNTPAYQKRKRSIVYFYAVSGLNCVLTWFVSFHTQAEANYNLLYMGLVLVGLIPIVWIDNRKDNNSSIAVVGSVFLHLFVTAMCAFSLGGWWMLIVYLLEIGVYFVVRKC